jgi:hypothetical protein
VPIVSGSGGAGAVTQLTTQTLSGTAATIDITAIPQNFTTIWLHAILRTNQAAITTTVNANFNGDGGANYDRVSLSGNNSVATSGAVGGGTSFFVGAAAGANATAGDFGVVSLYVPFYAATTANKVCVGGDGVFPTQGTATTFGIDAISQQWRSTAAINRVTLTPAAGSFVAGSAVVLYGLA